jgi:diaminopimelate decarboxylase
MPDGLGAGGAGRADGGEGPGGAQGNPDVRRLGDWRAEPLRDLADEHGTPLYVMDLRRVRQNALRLRQAFPDADVAYAVKANTVGAVMRTLADAGVDAECASAGEVPRALDAGFPPEQVRYTAVNPPARDLDHVLGLAAEEGRDLVVTVGAEDTLDRVLQRGFDGRLCVRVNPGVGAGHHEKVSTGAEPKFGVPYDRAAATADRAREAGLDLVGVHAHAGSGISGEDLSAHRELVRRMGALAREVEPSEFVAVGGGFGVPYHDDEPALDLGAVAEATREALGPVEARLAIEPGRYFVADAGVLLTTVNTVKETPEETVVGIDAGMTTLIRPALYDAYHAVRSLEPADPKRDPVRVTLAGPVCETADVLGRQRELPSPTRGDLLAVGNAGAYGYEMSSQYNSIPRPAVVAVDGDETRVAARRETLSDLTRLEDE